MSIQGLDVSEIQGMIDWKQVKAAGYQFAMLKAGSGFDTLDQQFKRNASECNRIGFPIGVYWFCCASTPEAARQEAEGCIHAISPYRVDYPVCYHFVSTPFPCTAQTVLSPPSQLATQIVENFCDKCEEKGYYAMYYTDRKCLESYFPEDLLARYALWYSFYNTQFDGTNCGMWQHTRQGHVPGINGYVNLDTSFEEYPNIIKKAGLNHLDRTTPDPKLPILSKQEYITYVVQPGDTLSRIALRYKTTYQALAALNVLSTPNLIYPGQTIRVPEDTEHVICIS